jgi:hypothetical protein
LGDQHLEESGLRQGVHQRLGELPLFLDLIRVALDLRAKRSCCFD